MRVLRGAAGLAVCGLPLAGCAIPSDDNPHEPSRRPRAQLFVADWSPQGGPCPNDAPPPGTAVAVAPIGHCLVLDARGSEDGDGGRVRFRFAGPGVDVVTGNPWVVIPAPARLALPLGELHEYSVTVRDGAGNADTATASVILENRRPVVGAGVGRTLPEGGFPWARGEDFVFDIPVTLSDPDGDALRACWSVNGGPEACGLLHDDAIHVSVPPARARFTYSIRAFDDVERSLPVFVEVTIAPPSSWTDGGPPVRIDPTWTALPGTLTWHGGAGLHEPLDGSGPVIARALAGDVLEIRTWPDASFVDSLPIDITAGAGSVGLATTIHVDRDRGRVWAGSLETTLGQSVRFVGQAWTLGGGGVAEILPATSAGSDGVPDSELGTQPIAALGSGGSLWLARTEGDVLAGLDASGATWICDVGEGSVSAIAKRPSREETWATAYGLRAHATLLRLSRDCAHEAFELPASVALGLGFAGVDLLWVATGDRGVLLLDLDELLATADPGSAIVLEIPEVMAGVQDGGEMRVDPATGTLWVPAGAGTWEVTVSGQVSLHPGYVVASGWDRDGRALFNRGDLVSAHAASPAHDAISASAPPQTASVALDWITGGVWGLVPVDTSLTRIARTDRAGRVLQSVAGYYDEDNAAMDAMPLMFDVFATVDGSHLWGRGDVSSLTGDPINLYVFEVADARGEALDPPRGRRLTAIGNANVDDIAAVLPLAPVTGTAARLAWVLVIDEVAILDVEAPAEKAVLFTHATQRLASGGRSLATNDVCFTTIEPGPAPASLELGRLRVSGGPPVFTVPLAGNGGFATAASDAEADACWFAWRSGGTRFVRAYDRDGVLLHAFNPGADVSGLASSSAHEVLLNELGTIRRVRFAPTAGGGVIANDVIATGVGTGFIQP